MSEAEELREAIQKALDLLEDRRTSADYRLGWVREILLEAMRPHAVNR